MDLITSTDWLVFVLVVGARFLLPLLIPFYPLPAIVLCLLLDGVDQTIFQVFTTLPLDGYQSYDKALDIYYLTVAYVSTFRNWTHLFAFRVSRFLLYLDFPPFSGVNKKDRNVARSQPGSDSPVTNGAAGDCRTPRCNRK